TIEVVVKPEPPPATCRIADKAIWVPKTAVQNSGQQMYTNNRTAINAIRRMNALRAWVNGKLTLGDICRHSLTAIDLAPAIPVENRELNRPASPQSSGRPVTFSRDTSSSQGRLPLGQPQFEAVERRLRTAEERFVTLRNRLMQGVVGRDFAAAHPAQVILDQKLFASPSPRPTNPGRPTPPTPPGARAPWLLCSRGGTAATVFADLKCHQRRAARITHLSNVTRRTLLNRIHGELGSFSRVESTSPELVQVGLARLRQGSSPGAADPDARSACPSDDDLKSQLCKDTNNGTDSPAARSAVRRHLQGVYKDENDYMGAAVKYFGVLDRSLGSVHITPNAN
ncbi:MAG: hypothetical protein OEM67_11445, partial [Thermoleophilia bacterium]|nr:hypothetical protein [Thermoleophilia bacterium]